MNRSVTLGQLFEACELGSTSASFVIKRIGEIENIQAGDAIFVSSEIYLKKINALDSLPTNAFFFINKKLNIPAKWQNTNFVLCAEPMWVMAKLSQMLFLESKPNPGVDPKANVSAEAKIGKNVCVGAFASIGAGAQIGDGTIIHSGVRIGENVILGAGCVIFPNVVIYDRSELGSMVRIHANSVIGADGFGYAQKIINSKLVHEKIDHLGRVVIGSNVEIGASTTIDRGTLGDTVIGSGTKIDNQVQIGHNCKIGEAVIICGSTGIAGSCEIGSHCVIAGFVGIGHGTKIGTGTTIAGMSMVFGEIPAGVTWGGIPVRPLREALKLNALVARLPELFKAYKLDKRKDNGE